MTASPLSPARARRLVAGALIVVIAALAGPSVARAHTDFDTSTPADQESVEGPLDEVTVSFTNPATPAGDGFELLDPTGAVRAPTSIDPTDETNFVLAFDPPLAAGTYGLRWRVQAGDAHPIDGAFQFEVTDSTPVVAADAAADERDAAAGPVTASPATTLPANPAVSEAAGTAEEPAALAEFLAAESSPSGTAAAAGVGRALTFAGTIFGVGALAALVWVIRGRRDELRGLIGWIRLAGLAIAAGGLVELASLQATTSTDVGELLGTKAGLAAIFKVVGGVTVWFGFHERAGRLVAPPHALSAAVATDLPPNTPLSLDVDHHHGHRWSPTTSAGLGLVGYSLVLASFWFDGHTVSKGPWAFHSLINFVHLGAAAVWGGGVFAMATVAWVRRRRSEHAGLAAMVIRFSTLATISLTAVIVAGLAMAALIVDSPSDLFATEWGRVLLIKVAAVSVAAGLGAYNHFKLRPALERSPDDPELARELRVSLTVESVTFAIVVVLTAWLVAAAT